MSNFVRVVVASTDLRDIKEFQGKYYGWQSAAIYNGGDFPAPFQVNTERGHEYAPGEYTIDPRSFRPDDRNNLQLKKVKLIPMAGGNLAPKPAQKAG